MLPTDFGPVSQSALRHTVPIARRFGAHLYLLHVIRTLDHRALDDAWRAGQAYMTDQFIAGEFDGIDYSLLVEAGDVWGVTSRKIEELEIDLVVSGARSRSGLGKLLLGSVAETIFRQSTRPVLLVGENAPSHPAHSLRSILFCTGFSGHSLNAGAYALRMAERQKARLTILHIIKEAPPEAERARLTESAKARMRELIPPDLGLVDEPEFLVEFGVPAERILQVAGERDIDLILMGVRQPAGFARRFRWATAYEVVTQARCPVLTVRMTEVP